MSVEPGRLPKGREEHGIFRLEPGQRLLLVAEAFRCYPGPAGGQRKRSVTEPVKQLVGAAGGVQVVIKHPVPCRMTVVLGVVGVGHFGGVRTKQVVKCEPARNSLGNEMSPGQLGQCGPDLFSGQAGETDNGRYGDVWSEMKPQQPEQAPAGNAEPLVGPGEYRPHISGLVLAVECVQRTAGAA